MNHWLSNLLKFIEIDLGTSREMSSKISKRDPDNSDHWHNLDLCLSSEEPLIRLS